MIKLKAYTLAEVLVTMAILGVIIALSTRALNDAKPNTEMVMFKKAYYTTSRIVSELVNDDDLYPENLDDIAHDGLANIRIENQTANGEARFKGREYSGPTKFCDLFSLKLNVGPGCNFTTPDGIQWSLPSAENVFNRGNTDEYIVVDVNGPRAGQNCTLDDVWDDRANVSHCGENQVPDSFIITVGKYGEVSPNSELSRRYLSSKKTTRSFKKLYSCINGYTRCSEQ